MIKPIGNRLLIKPVDDGEETTDSGIVVVTPNKDRAMRAVILAMGNGEFVDSNPHDSFKVGDEIICARYAGDDLRVQENDKFINLKIIMADSVFGIA